MTTYWKSAFYPFGFGVMLVLPSQTASAEVVLQLAQMKYDAQGRLECTAVRMDPAQWASQADACVAQIAGPNGPDRVARNVYDAAGQLVQLRKGVGTSSEVAEATYSYTPNGKKEYVIDGQGNRAQFTWDGFDRQSSWIFPSPARPSAFNGATQATALSTAGTVNSADYEQYTHDPNGNRSNLRKRDGRTLKYTYDALNRVTSKCVTTTTSCVVPGSTTGRDVYYDYDLAGRQLSASFDSNTGSDNIANSYDALGRLTSSTVSIGGLTKNVCSQAQPCLYDANNNRTQVTVDGQTFTYAYDALSRLTNVYEGTGVATPLDTFAYNADATLSRRTEGAIATPNATVDYIWDAIGRLTNQTDAFPSASASNVSWAFTSSDPMRKLNPASEIVNESRDNDAYAWRGAFAVNRGYQINGLNQYTTAGTASFTYDANGNLIGDGTNTFVYDAENRLVSATAGGTTTNLTYDPLGRLWRVQKGSADTRFLYDGDALVAEFDSSGNLTNRYVHGSNAAADDPLVWYVGSGTGTKRFLHADHLGSIVASTNASGAPSINTYDEYGIPGTNNTGRFQYTGQAWLGELGMSYYKARMYSPTLGRFMQTDPIGYKDQINLYAYVGDDPVNGADPSGLQSVPGTFSINSACGGNASCIQGYREGQHNVAGVVIDFVAGDLIRAYQNPTWTNVAIAAISIAPVGKLEKGASAVFHLASAAETRLAQSALRSAAVESVSALRRGGGRVIGSGADGSFRHAADFAHKYGGSAGDYEKVATGTIARGSDGSKVEVHFVRNTETGQVWDLKYKVQGGSR